MSNEQSNNEPAKIVCDDMVFSVHERAYGQFPTFSITADFTLLSKGRIANIDVDVLRKQLIQTLRYQAITLHK